MTNVRISVGRIIQTHYQIKHFQFLDFKFAYFLFQCPDPIVYARTLSVYLLLLDISICTSGSSGCVGKMHQRLCRLQALYTWPMQIVFNPFPSASINI